MPVDTRQFDLNISAFVKKVGILPEKLVKSVAFDLFARVVKKTPVDTGRARSSWNIAVNKQDLSMKPEGLSSYPPARAGLLSVGPGDIVWTTNNLPYVGELENGHSWQAPLGMVAVSMEEVKLNIASQIADGVKDAGL